METNQLQRPLTNSQNEISVEVLMNQAEGLVEQKSYENALEAYTNLLGNNLTEALRFEVHKNMGNAFLKFGDIEGARASYKKAANIFPGNPTLLVNFGVLEMQTMNLPAAKKYFSGAVGKDSGLDAGWVGMALVHRGYGDLDLSRGCMLRALDENPFNKTALVQYYKWCRDDDVEAGIELVESYLESAPDDDEIVSLLNQYNA